jgi:bzd-type benzoyl-CoA reductase N subunit
LLTSEERRRMKAEDILGELRDIYANRHQWNRKRHEQGQKYMGWICTYIPEEIIEAAGITPVRVLGGNEETPIADAHLYSNLCTFVRSALEEAFMDKYDYLDGFVALNACDHIRRLYDVWSIYLKEKTPFTAILSVPGKVSENTIAVFKDELEVFKEKLEKYFEVKITDKALKDAIALYNTTRSLLKEIFVLRKDPQPPLTGAEAMEIVLAGMVMPKDIYNEKLKSLLEALKSRSPVPNAGERVRLLIMGSELQNPEYIQVIEDLGGLVVNDDLCIGTRYFWNLVDNQDKPLDALARRYVTRNPCPRMRPQEDRIKRLKQMIQDYRVEAVIYECIKFCDMHGAAYPIVKRGLAEIGIPVLKLDREHILSGVGQVKTRTQAFFESIGV